MVLAPGGPARRMHVHAVTKPTAKEATMHKHWLRPLTLIGFIALLFHVPVAEAQFTEARGLIDNARKLYTTAVDALAAGKLDSALTPLDDYQENVRKIEEALYKQVQELHDTDRSVLVPKVHQVLDKNAGCRGAATVAIQTIKAGKTVSSSEVSSYISQWQDCDDRYKRLLDDLNAYWRQMQTVQQQIPTLQQQLQTAQDRVKRYQQFCGRDCS